jgi:hypothetical protein
LGGGIRGMYCFSGELSDGNDYTPGE